MRFTPFFLVLALFLAIAPAIGHAALVTPMDTNSFSYVEGDAQIDDVGSDGSGNDLQANTSVLGVGAGSTISATPDAGDTARSVLYFALPTVPSNKAPGTATLTLVFNRAFDTPINPISVYHSLTANNLEVAASDYENSSFNSDLGDLTIPGSNNSATTFDLTSAVLAEYAAEGNSAIIALRLQMDSPQGYARFNSADNSPQPQIEVTFIPEPGIGTVIALSAFSLLSRRRSAVAIQRQGQSCYRPKR